MSIFNVPQQIGLAPRTAISLIYVVINYYIITSLADYISPVIPIAGTTEWKTMVIAASLLPLAMTGASFSQILLVSITSTIFILMYTLSQTSFNDIVWAEDMPRKIVVFLTPLILSSIFSGAFVLMLLENLFLGSA